ncbi:MAG: hypothetical protein ACSLFP_09835 [Acidimicrobiales bacterium]
MTDDLDLLPSPSAPDVGHPVRSFVAVLVLVAVALMGLRWTGALWPQVHPGMSGFDASVLPDGRVGEYLELHNDGALTVRVLAVDWPSQGLLDPVVELLDQPAPGAVDLAARGPATDFEIPAGGSVAVLLSGRPTCNVTAGSPRLHVDAWFGPDRTVEVSEAGPQSLLGNETC